MGSFKVYLVRVGAGEDELLRVVLELVKLVKVGILEKSKLILAQGIVIKRLEMVLEPVLYLSLTFPYLVFKIFVRFFDVMVMFVLQLYQVLQYLMKLQFRCKQLQLKGEMKVNFVLEVGGLLVLLQKLFLVNFPQPPQLLQELFKRWQLPLTR